MAEKLKISRPPPNAVTYDLTSPYETTITLPPGSIWSSGLHWHETHDEYLQVINGTIRVRLNEKSFFLKAGEEIKIPKFARHEWHRANVGSEGDGDEVIVKEWTVPTDVDKSIFFWALNSAILSTTTQPRNWVRSKLTGLEIRLKLFTIFYDLDNWPVFLDLGSVRFRTVEWIITHCILLVATIIMKIAGWDFWKEKMIPPSLLEERKKKKI
jgi:mannose-6-phosphate isomerase-like protein (cupin superfamily)